MSYANSGSVDNWILEKCKLTRMKKFKPFERMYQRMYVFPFARHVFQKEIRLDLVEIRAHYRISNKRKNKQDFESSKAIELIDNELKEIPIPKKKNIKQWIIGTKEILIPITTLPVFTSVLTFAQEYFPFIILGGVMILLLVTPFLINKLTEYLMNKLWYKIIKKKLGIDELKNRLIKEIINENESYLI